MEFDPEEMARARMALQDAVSSHLFDRDRRVYLIDIGRYEQGGQIYDKLAVRFHVDSKIQPVQLQAMGKEPLNWRPIRDIPTMVMEGKYHLHQWSGWGRGWGQWSDPYTSRTDPLQGGISISTGYYYSGTLGGIVRDRAAPDNKMILSNWHVLVTYWGAPRGQPILQPGRYDGGSGADVIATLERDAMSANLDAAVATLNGSRRLSNDQLGIGSVKGVGRATIDMEVKKSGRTSRVTSGRVTGVGGTQRITYGWLERVIRDVVTIEPLAPGDPPVSQGGDSGSWWVDSATREAVGLHFAGSDYPSRGLALDMQEVLNALNVEIPPTQ